MKISRLIIFSFVFTTIFAISAFAQTDAPTKIALINTDSFYAETGGITKIATAYKTLNDEFKTDLAGLEATAKRLQSLQDEVQALQVKANDPKNQVPIDKSAAQAKVEEGEKLQRDYKFKQEDVKARYSKREAAVLAPITQDVGKAIGEYAKQKGYTLVMDSGKLFQVQALIYLQESTDITKEFVQYYNTRPAGTAATTTKP